MERVLEYLWTVGVGRDGRQDATGGDHAGGGNALARLRLSRRGAGAFARLAVGCGARRAAGPILADRPPAQDGGGRLYPDRRAHALGKNVRKEKVKRYKGKVGLQIAFH